nr:MAG TPA_asm: tail fiber protein [Bacteriophage sp.]
MVSILHSDASETALEYGVDYTVNDLSMSLTTPAQVGEHIIIYRQTSTDKIVTWNDGSILLARDMNTEDAQMLHLQEEQQDYIMAHAISTKVTSDKEVLWDALNHRVINVSDPKDPQDAVTKHYMESVQNGFVTANTILVQEATKQASAAKSSQEAAKTSETNAKTSETNSEISHQKAKKWAEATDSPDDEADTDSTTGKTQSSKEWALYSKTKAQEAATSATNAKSSETNAKTSETNAKTSETKAAVSEANAKTSESNAKSSETKSKDSENAARVSEQNAAESARLATENAMDFNMLKRNKVYSIGDIAYSSYLPSWARLECVTAGTTADKVPFSITMVSSGGGTN